MDVDRDYVICLGQNLGFYVPTIKEGIWVGSPIEEAELFDKKTAYWVVLRLIEAGYENAIVLKYQEKILA